MMSYRGSASSGCSYSRTARRAKIRQQCRRCHPLPKIRPSQSRRTVSTFSTRLSRPRDDLERLSDSNLFAPLQHSHSHAARISPSDIPPNVANYTATAYVTDMLAILDQENVINVYLIGHDFDGGLVQCFTQTFSDRVSAMIILNAPIFPTLVSLLSYDVEAQQYVRYTTPYYSYIPGQPKDISTIVQPIRDTSYRRKIAKYLDCLPIFGMLSSYKNNYPGPTYELNLTAVLNITRENWVQSAPTMGIWGEEDEYFNPKTIDGLQSWFKSGVRLVTVPKVGHWPFRDQWKRVNEEIYSFLKVANEVKKSLVQK